MSERGNGSGLLIAFLAGAAAGAAVALLTAPEAGRDARARLRSWARDAQGGAEKLSGAVRAAATEGVSAAKAAFNEAYERKT
jgi:gas vesicle protein